MLKHHLCIAYHSLRTRSEILVIVILYDIENAVDASSAVLYHSLKQNSGYLLFLVNFAIKTVSVLKVDRA